MTITLVIIIFPDFYQKYYFCLKIVFNSLAFQKMKSIFRYFNLNAYEHLNVSAYGMKNYPKNVLMFQGSRHALHHIKFCLPFKCAIPLKKV